MSETGTIVMALAEQKSVGVAFLLTFLFGPLGMIYSTVKGAIIMMVVGAVVGVFTLGVGLAVIWPVSVLWGVMAANAHNKQVLQRLAHAA